MKPLIFASREHRTFYENCMARVRGDSYHRALFYLLGACDDTRRKVDSLFDFAEDCIKAEALHAGWQTSGSYRVCLFAFNLWNGFADENGQSTPSELFACGFAPYMMEALKLRYPEYCRELQPQRAKAPQKGDAR